jgi:tripartite-type tricarboxylate transporter receptor subunit TctC
MSLYRFSLALVATVLSLSLVAPVAAQPYPSKSIRILVGFPPGGGLDFTTRLLAPHLAEQLGQQVLVENKPGAAGVIAHTEIARSAPDGYTLIIGNIGPLALAPNMMDKRPYDPTRDFTAIGQILATYFVVTVPANHPAKTLSEFIAWAKQNDGRVNFASGGNGSITHLNGELFNKVAGLRMTHIPYKGSAPAITDMMAGQTHLLVDVGSVLKPQVLGGKLKALAVTSPTRDNELPNVPTVREAGMADLETAGWQGLIGPPGMPAEVVNKLHAALKSALAKADVRDRLEKAGTPVAERDPAAFAAFIRSENERWLPLIKASGAKIE